MMDKEIFDLTPDQQKAFRRLKKAYKDCEKLGIYFVNRYSSLHAYYQGMVKEFGNHDSGFNEEETIKAYDAIGDTNYLRIPAEWADDESEHLFHLTPKALRLLQNQ